ncbi:MULTISPECIES: DUF748 domain-containing protein [Comamonas]|uniref:DUF748 domain-containing protein n=1 Tax=Comamonas TaxID=283 RepID=UPI000621FF11|nr:MULTISPECIES: DUF748 domain-containing protein [Comamonas]KKI15853.1 AsmA [Comamonas thiooxydans]TYK74759.1 DUF748 domain-containing protein [Comamonas sp. Z1]BCX52324.1 hypothetical protein CTYAZ2_19060 [Comamonas testosteroni]
MSLLTSNRWLRRLIWSVLALLLLWLLLWAVVPWVAKSQLEKRAAEKLGRGVHVGKIEFAPWAMSITLHELVIDKAIKKVAETAHPEGSAAQKDLKSAAEPQLQIKRIFINASAQSLFRLAPVLDAIEVDAPVVRLTQHSLGKLDIDDVIARLSEPEDEEPSKPLSFALYNIAVRDGRIELNDEFVQRKHELKDLQLSIPFISNLASKREIKVLPHLAFDLNGSKFDTSGESTPFTDTRQTAMQLKWEHIDLAPYLGYVPASVPVQPLSGVLDTDLQISFEQKDQPVVSISGKLALSNVAVQDRQSAPLLNFDTLEVQLKNVQPLQNQVALESVRWVKPEVHASRNAQGVINWLGLNAPAGAPAAPLEKAVPEPASAEASTPAQADAKAEKPGKPLVVGVQQFDIEGGIVHWQDAATGAAPAALTLAPLVLQAKNLAWPMNAPLQLTATAGLQAAEQARVEGAARLALDGEATDKAGNLNLKLEQMPLQWVQPYMQAHFKPQLSAMLNTDARISWGEGGVVAEVAELTADKLQLQDKQAPVNIEQIKVSGVQVDLAARQVQVEAIAVQKPQLAALRDAQGHWMYERWLPVAAPAAKPATQGSKAEPGKPWSVKLAAIAVDGGALQFRDAAPVQGGNARPVQLDVSALRIRMGAFEPLAAKAAPTPLEVSAQLAASRRVQAGHIQFKGQLGLTPVSAQGQLQARAVPLHALEPYFGHKLNVDLVRADGNFRGKLNYLAHAKGPQLSVSGDVELNDLRVRSTLAAPVQEEVGKPSTAKGALTAVLNDSTADRAKALAARTGLGLGDDLLAWKTLVVRGLDLNMQPAQPLRVSVRETALSDFFARVIVQRNGRINLQDIVKTERSEQSVAQNEEANAQAAAGEKPELSRPVAEPAKPEDVGPAPIIKVGPIVLTGGKVQFSDYFIQPNYSADLSELNGRLSAFSSQAPAGQVEPQMADLEIKGKAQGTAKLDISGKVNPLAKPLALDVRAQMNDLELSPLSPYSIKYAGYGIERGKLYMDVNYKVQPDGQLTASNKLVLRQLTFGDKVEGAPASLPVKLAVALLSDRNGVIDLDVPLSGSLNDPQFRLAPIIFKVIGNIIMKAVTAPFALLSGAFSGGDESGAVNFAPGSAKLDGKAREQLTKIVKALNDRPALKMTVVGESREAEDKEAWKTEELDRLLLAQKRRNVIREGKSGDEVMEFSDAERPALLKAVYGRADIKKPRNMVGMAKDLPADQMTALLVASIKVPDDAMRELALARGVAVRDYLATQQLPLERLFLGAPKLDVQDKDWTPRAQLSLSAQ